MLAVILESAWSFHFVMTNQYKIGAPISGAPTHLMLKIMDSLRGEEKGTHTPRDTILCINLFKKRIPELINYFFPLRSLSS